MKQRQAQGCVADATGSEIWESQAGGVETKALRGVAVEILIVCTLRNPSVRGRMLQLFRLRQWTVMGDEQVKLRVADDFS